MSESDNQLLDRYVTQDDQAAFEQLIRRHTSMVLGVCNSLLWKKEDAEDAFQAVFILLSKRAPKLRKHNSVGGWLHGVAFRICLKHRVKISRPREIALQNELTDKALEPWQKITASRDTELLHHEISKLPQSYRDVIVLCYLEGKSREQAANALGVSIPSVKASLARGRKLLRRRLLKQGVAITVALGVAATCSKTTFGSNIANLGSTIANSPAFGSTSVTESLIQSTLQHCQGQAPQLAIGTGAETVHTLIAKETAVMNFTLTQTVLAASICIVICALSVGAIAQPTTQDQLHEIELMSAQDSSEQVLIDVVPTVAESVQRDKDQNPNHNAKDEPPVEAPNRSMTFLLPSMTEKSAEETWDVYVEKMQRMNYMTAEEVARWKAGEQVTVEHKILATKMREESKSGYYPVKRTQEVVRNGKTVTESFVEYVKKESKTMVPYTVPAKGSMTLPIRGSVADNIEFSGMKYPRNIATFDSEKKLLPPTPKQVLIAGDKVRAKRNFETKVKNAKVDQVVAGETYTIQETNGKWCALQEVDGWLPIHMIESLEVDAEPNTSDLEASRLEMLRAKGFLPPNTGSDDLNKAKDRR